MSNTQEHNANSAYHELMQLYEQKELIHRLVGNGNSNSAELQGKLIGNPVDGHDQSTISPPPIAAFGENLNNSDDQPIALKKVPFSLHSPPAVANGKEGLAPIQQKLDKLHHIANLNGNNRTSPPPGNNPHHHVNGTYHTYLVLFSVNKPELAGQPSLNPMVSDKVLISLFRLDERARYSYTIYIHF